MNLEERLAARLTGVVVVVGVGNPLRGDDGAGCQAAARLRGVPGVRVVLAEEVPESHLGAIADARPDVVALIDAVDLGAAPGSVALLERDDLPAGGGTTHHAPLALVMEVLAHMTGADVFLLAIQPQSTFLGGPVSVEVATAAEGLASIIAGALATRVAFGEVVRGAVAEDSSPC